MNQLLAIKHRNAFLRDSASFGDSSCWLITSGLVLACASMYPICLALTLFLSSISFFLRLSLSLSLSLIKSAWASFCQLPVPPNTIIISHSTHQQTADSLSSFLPSLCFYCPKSEAVKKAHTRGTSAAAFSWHTTSSHGLNPAGSEKQKQGDSSALCFEYVKRQDHLCKPGKRARLMCFRGHRKIKLLNTCSRRKVLKVTWVPKSVFLYKHKM